VGRLEVENSKLDRKIRFEITSRLRLIQRFRHQTIFAELKLALLMSLTEVRYEAADPYS
jgi:hypothetical protein